MAFSLSPRENYLLCLQHKPHEYTPGPMDAGMAGALLSIDRPSSGEGLDGFGVRWVSPLSGGAGSALPAPNEFLLTDVTRWKSVVRLPDVSSYDWAALSAQEEALGMIDRSKAVQVFHSTCIYERMAALMGFEGALLALALEPEASFELLSALTDVRIEMIRHFKKYYNPDIYIYFDDVATERMMFMSPDTYRTLIKPLHTKIVAAAREEGMIPLQHTCGKADLIVEDMMDEGCDGWHAVQAQNNLEQIIEQYGDRFVLVGGYNTTGAPGQPTASEAMVRAEVRRCLQTYGKYGQGYIFFGMVLTERNPDNPFDSGTMNAVMNDEFLKIRAEKEAVA